MRPTTSTIRTVLALGVGLLAGLVLPPAAGAATVTLSPTGVRRSLPVAGLFWLTAAIAILAGPARAQVTTTILCTPLTCDDADPCTLDVCDALLGCQHSTLSDGRRAATSRQSGKTNPDLADRLIDDAARALDDLSRVKAPA